MNHQSGTVTFRPAPQSATSKLALTVTGPALQSEAMSARVFSELGKEFAERGLHMPDGFTPVDRGGTPGLVSHYLSRQADLKDGQWVDGAPLPWESVDANGMTGTELKVQEIRGMLSDPTFSRKVAEATDAVANTLNVELEVRYEDQEALFHYNETPANAEGPIRRLREARRGSAANYLRRSMGVREKDRAGRLLAAASARAQVESYGAPGVDFNAGFENARLKPAVIEYRRMPDGTVSKSTLPAPNTKMWHNEILSHYERKLGLPPRSLAAAFEPNASERGGGLKTWYEVGFYDPATGKTLTRRESVDPALDEHGDDVVAQYYHLAEVGERAPTAPHLRAALEDSKRHLRGWTLTSEIYRDLVSQSRKHNRRKDHWALPALLARAGSR